MSKKNRSFLPIVALVVLVALYFGGAFDRDRQPQTQSTSPAPSAVRSGDVSNFIDLATWPPPSDSNAVVMLPDPLVTNYYVILDASGSMNTDVRSSGTRMEIAKDALRIFYENLPQGSNFGLFTFSPARELLPLGAVDRDRFLSALSPIRASGGTPLVESMKLGFQALTNQAQRQSGYGRYVLVVVTDGDSSDGNPAPLAREIVAESMIELQTIGFGVRNHSLNIDGVTEYVTANSPQSLIDALNSVIEGEADSFVDPTDFVD